MRARIRSGSLVAILAAGAALVVAGAAGCEGAGPGPLATTAALGTDDGTPGEPQGYGGGQTVSAEYQFPATIDPEVQGDRFTELWARVYRPERLEPRPALSAADLPARQPRHLRSRGQPPHRRRPHLHLHRRRARPATSWCRATPATNTLASDLAALGYIVVSINANRGINAAPGVPGDPGLNLARGRLILKHLALLSRWNRDLEPTPPRWA